MHDLVEPIVALVARRTGVPAQGELLEGVLVIRPAELSGSDGFCVEVRKDWRSVDATFVPGRFARPLIQRLSAAPMESRLAFAALAAEAKRAARIKLRINGDDISAAGPEQWPHEWTSLELSVRKGRMDFEELPTATIVREIGDLASMVFGMIVALIGVDDVEADESAREGDPRERLSRTYERKPINREVCLSLKGRRCYCCNFDFEQTYGSIADGFIEVHHRVPVAGMGPGYLVHPVRDLFPVCSNCHSVIHLTDVAMDPDELRVMLSNRRQNERATT